MSTQIEKEIMEIVVKKAIEGMDLDALAAKMRPKLEEQFINALENMDWDECLYDSIDTDAIGKLFGNVMKKAMAQFLAAPPTQKVSKKDKTITPL